MNVTNYVLPTPIAKECRDEGLTDRECRLQLVVVPTARTFMEPKHGADSEEDGIPFSQVV